MTRDEYLTLLAVLLFLCCAGTLWHVEQRNQERWSAVNEIRR